MFVAARQSNKIECWDPRYMANPLYVLQRPGMTQQRISMSIDCTGQFLASGDTVNRVFYLF